MKRLIASIGLTLLPFAVQAHEAGAAHAHPHADWQVLLVLGAAITLGCVVVLGTMNRNKDD